MLIMSRSRALGASITKPVLQLQLARRENTEATAAYECPSNSPITGEQFRSGFFVRVVLV